MAQKYLLTIIKNGRTLTEDEEGDALQVRPGDNLLEALGHYGFPVKSTQKLMIDGETMEASDLEAFSVEDDLEITFLNKSEGGK